jgi:4-amino-4-deoxy-L-arabinose transferase-like glycosyltransferase
VSICFFLGTASFNYLTQKGNFIKWSSPDESANYIFTKLYAQTGRLSFFEKYNLLAADVMHPRSYLSQQGWLKPISFLGIILIYGKIANLTSYKILPYLTPFFAALGIFFYYLLVKEVFGRRNGLISALLLASFPPFIYYSARSFFHNMLFMVLLIISFYLAVLMVKAKPGQIDGKAEKVRPWNLKSLGAALAAGLKALGWPEVCAALSGLFLGLAVMVRSSELIWLAPVWLILWLFNLKKIGFAKLVIFISFLLLALLPLAYWNQILYQSPWRGGYSEMNQAIANMAGASVKIIESGGARIDIIKDSSIQIKNNFFHFGFWPLKSLKMLYFYFAGMFFWLFWPAIFGLLLFLKKIKKWKKRHYAYLVAYTAAFFILLFYYGSWDFHDNPDPKSHTIGNSYVRYWLPIYLGVLPLASFFLVRLLNIFRKKILIYGFYVLMLAAIFFISLKFVLFGSAESLSQTVQKSLASRPEYNQVLALTEPWAVIITQYHDKLFFPERKVIAGLFNDDSMIKQYAVLSKYLPVYYYNFTLPEKDINYLNQKKMLKFNLQIRPVAKVTKDFTLYRVENAELKSQNVR